MGTVAASCVYYFFSTCRWRWPPGAWWACWGASWKYSLANRKIFLIEVQLGDAIDLMVAALQVGVGVLNALESAVNELRPPLRPQLEEVLGRIRYGDDPQLSFATWSGACRWKAFDCSPPPCRSTGGRAAT